MQILTGYGKTDIILDLITVLYKNTFGKVLSALGDTRFHTTESLICSTLINCNTYLRLDNYKKQSGKEYWICNNTETKETKTSSYVN